MANVYQDPAMKQTLARIVRSNMDLSGNTYRSLSQILSERYGIEHNPDTLRNKVSTGALGAQMFLFMMMAMDAESLAIEQVKNIYQKIKNDH